MTLWAEADLTTVRDRAKVILFARDWYGSTEQSIGPIPGRENIIASGWIDGDSIEWNPEQGSVTFTVQGPAWWLDQMVTFPLGMDNVTSAPTDWLHYKNLTMDAFCWRLLHWHSTATTVIDVKLSGDTRLASGLNSPWGPSGNS